MRQRTLIAAWLFIAASGCSKPPVESAASHPPAMDLRCPAEPAALTREQVIADVDGSVEQQFTLDAIMAGRACRDALQRTCQWHKDRGMDVDCTEAGQ